jgi:lipoate---protein ligase
MNGRFSEAFAALPWMLERIEADPVDTFTASPFDGFGRAKGAGGVGGDDGTGSSTAEAYVGSAVSTVKALLPGDVSDVSAVGDVGDIGGFGKPGFGGSRLVRVHTVTRPAIVLGAAQQEAVIDREAAEANGIAVVRRRSGGGAVWLDAASVSWIDVTIGVTDPLWDADVGRAFWWLGELWADSLRTYDPSADLAVHQGALLGNEWSKLVCFAGLGPGEVSLGGHKVIGIAQKRTREGALFQCGVLHGWDPSMLLHYCALSDADRTRAYEDLEDACTTVPPSIVETFLSKLAT